MWAYLLARLVGLLPPERDKTWRGGTMLTVWSPHLFICPLEN